jgi:glycerophosphoryl diester phosphodiesterase
MAAFERAVELGAPFIETDLHLTRDARFVAIHDATLERTTNGRGTVHEASLAELRELDAGHWFDRQYMGQRIPTLEEILNFSRQHDVVFYLEIKFDSAWGMHHALVAALQNAQNTARTIIISFDPSMLVAMRRVDPSIMTGLLFEASKTDVAKTAVEVGARQICPRSAMVTPELVAAAHAADLHVAAWTVNKADEMRNMIALGVDGVMTDFPDRLRAVLEDAKVAK